MFRNSETAQRMLEREGVTAAADDAPKLIRMSPLRHSFGAHTLPTPEPDGGKAFIKGKINVLCSEICGAVAAFFY